jgi:hypothetical protein
MRRLNRSLIAVVWLSAAVMTFMPGVVLAQTEGRVSVGASVTGVFPTDGDVGSVVGFGPLVRLNPKKGWGFAGALNWFRADLEDPAGSGRDFARLRVRHLMAGVGYTIGPERVLTTFSVVAGPSFNKVEFRDEFRNAFPGAEIDVDTSFAIRPGVSVTFTVAPRVGIVGFGGYLYNKPDVTYRAAGAEFRNRWNASSVVISAGLVYSLF